LTLQRFSHLGEPHHQALELLCAKALERGDLATAYRLSDRRCRIRPLPDPHCFVLRAEALYRMADRTAAIDDLLVALRIAPDDLAANRRMLSWGEPARQLAAAKVLIECERDPRVLKSAVATLRKSGTTEFAAIKVHDDLIEGWALWQGGGPVCVVTTDEEGCVERLFYGDTKHPLSGELACAVDFRFPLQRAPQFISISANGNVLAEVRAGQGRPSLASRTAGRVVNRNAQVTVIVPVYADYRATKACLKALLGQLDETGCHQVVIVNDASPDPRIPSMLDALARSDQIRVLTNRVNLGFVGSVNRALDEISSGDVVLLNADTIVPERFLERLAAAAQSAPDVGTVTPLSNNGEFTSFPVPNRSNAIGDGFSVGGIDRVAARVNAGAVVDIPNGIGFCLYVTRSCLDAVGRLSDSYCRGYLEDVDFCLRARLHGFRNVCAGSVYVGHAGSRSFRNEKRSLVVRNLKVLERRFPAYRAECADFILADPLKPLRRAIEASLLHARSHGVLLVTGGGAIAEVARERARQLVRGEMPAVLILEIQFRRGRIVAKLLDARDAMPQSIEFLLPSPCDPSDLVRFLDQLSLQRIEFFDLCRLSSSVVKGLLKLSIPYDFYLAHTELGLGQASSRDSGQVAKEDVIFFREVIAGAGHVFVHDGQAEAIARSLALEGITRVAAGATTAKGRRSSKRSGVAARLGLVPVRQCAQEHQFMREIIARLAVVEPALDVLVLGGTHDDTDLMRAGAFVTGRVEPAELHRLFCRYQLDRILLCLTRPLFGHPLLSTVMTCRLPVAYLDWSRGNCPFHEADLRLEPSSQAYEAAERLLPWLRGDRKL
jgi:GT2 family glycosyltransferase